MLRMITAMDPQLMVSIWILDVISTFLLKFSGSALLRCMGMITHRNILCMVFMIVREEDDIGFCQFFGQTVNWLRPFRKFDFFWGSG